MRYRRSNDKDAWHFCVNCPRWPRENFEEEPARPVHGELCSECQARLILQTCETLPT